MTSKARELLKNDKSQTSGPDDSFFAKIGEWVRTYGTVALSSGMAWSSWAYKHSRTIGWWVVTTGMITALPLIFEVRVRYLNLFV